jgi:hypothetical protein|nr:MAG TPA: hypothetical protein [Caudoviricetes sp.]
MYYQLTLQFATSEIDDAKKVLELAKELDLKRAGLEEKLPEPETFPWEEDAPKQKAPKQEEPTIPRAKDWVPMEEPAPEPAKSEPKPVKVREITLEELQKAGVAFAKEKGVSVLKVFLTQMGASKICDIPKEKYQEAWEALHA